MLLWLPPVLLCLLFTLPCRCEPAVATPPPPTPQLGCLPAPIYRDTAAQPPGLPLPREWPQGAMSAGWAAQGMAQAGAHPASTSRGPDPALPGAPDRAGGGAVLVGRAARPLPALQGTPGASASLHEQSECRIMTQTAATASLPGPERRHHFGPCTRSPLSRSIARSLHSAGQRRSWPALCCWPQMCTAVHQRATGVPMAICDSTPHSAAPGLAGTGCAGGRCASGTCRGADRPRTCAAERNVHAVASQCRQSWLQGGCREARRTWSGWERPCRRKMRVRKLPCRWPSAELSLPALLDLDAGLSACPACGWACACTCVRPRRGPGAGAACPVSVGC